MANRITPSPDRTRTPARAPEGDVARFLQEARHVAPRRSAGRGRLIFSLDATMSRQPTWDLACHLQSGMFGAADQTGGLDVQLVYFRGYDEARASRWVSRSSDLKDLMQGLACHGGLTQIGRVLYHANKAARKAPVAALVYVGDAMEEDIDRLCQKAGELALRNTRAFMFLEGRDGAAEQAFREIARITGGVFLPFNAAAADELRELLGAIGAFAAGGRAALESTGTSGARNLLSQMPK